MIALCSCKHVYQDKKHGKGRRVFNTSTAKPQGGDDIPGRCSVCKATKSVRQAN